MFFAAKPAAGDDWNQIRGLMKIELKSLARQIKEIGKGVTGNDVSQKTAVVLMQAVRANAAVLIAAVTPITLPRAESAINAALGAIEDTVNRALGFELV
ncbi:MAG: hypothetical protein FJX52_07805 [Alphaproteobacteria bacterium]|nr:hypothetical protein [Alphaproteobacteria bacterium]